MKKIGFFGTPNLAKAVLKYLYDSGEFEISFVVTSVDKPAGRGLELKSSPVKEFSLDKNIKVFQPKKIRGNEEFFDEIAKFDVDYFIVVAYGKILPKEILNLPFKMCINIHGSILPKYRGASPIQSALINGDDETGITIMKMSEGMDEGEIIDILKMPIEKFDTSELIFNKFEELSGKFLLDTIDKLDRGLLKLAEQNNLVATYCQKINKEYGQADFNMNAKKLFNLWKGLTPWPGLYTFYKNKKLTIEECDYIDLNENLVEDLNMDVDMKEQIGKVIKINNQIGVICNDGILILKKIKLEGKKSQEVKDFINGYNDFIGYFLT